MIDAIKEALKRHLMKKEGHHPLTGALHEKVDDNEGESSHGDPNKSEQAPELEPYNNNMHAKQTGIPTMGDMATPADDGKQDQHQQILAALLGQGGHNGRPPSTLTEHVHDKAKAKVDAHNKGKTY